LGSDLCLGSSMGLLLGTVSRFRVNELVVETDQDTLCAHDSISYLPENGIR
jgi:hypothetical protein